MNRIFIHVGVGVIVAALGFTFGRTTVPPGSPDSEGARRVISEAPPAKVPSMPKTKTVEKPQQPELAPQKVPQESSAEVVAATKTLEKFQEEVDAAFLKDESVEDLANRMGMVSVPVVATTHKSRKEALEELKERILASDSNAKSYIELTDR